MGGPRGAAPSALFGAYDIRGRYPRDFAPEVSRRLADAFLANFPGPFVAARDTRTASRQLESTVVDRFRAKRRSVLELGVQPTPVVGFSSRYLRTVGLAFTPSHNAVGFAGIKAFGSNGESFGREWGRLSHAFSRLRTVPRTRARRVGGEPGGRPEAPSAKEAVSAYVAHITRGLSFHGTIVIDGRGGATTHLAPRALSQIGAKVRELHPTFSARFHGRSPEPAPDNIADLGRTVRSERADLGVAFDGDGDRVVFVDARGAWVEPEVIATFLHRHLSPARRPLVGSADVSQLCEKHAPTVRSRVGSRYIADAMRRHSAHVGFEASSHFYLPRWGPNSDGILVACVVSDLLRRRGTTLGELSRAFGPIVRQRSTLDFPTRSLASEHLRSLLRQLDPPARIGVDGFVWQSESGTVVFRTSNTQPSLRLSFEARPGGRLASLRRDWVRAQTVPRGGTKRRAVGERRTGHRGSPALTESRRPRRRQS